MLKIKMSPERKRLSIPGRNLFKLPSHIAHIMDHKFLITSKLFENDFKIFEKNTLCISELYTRFSVCFLIYKYFIMHIKTSVSLILLQCLPKYRHEELQISV